MKRRVDTVSVEEVQERILTLRGVKVLLDADLARVYGLSTKRLNEQFGRNRKKFPADFAFQLTAQEFARIRSQVVDDEGLALNWSQFATSSGRRRGAAYRPWAFTEHGALQTANVLNSPRAVAMSVYVIRAFVKMREILGATGELARQLKELEAKLTSRLDVHETAIVEVLQRIMDILKPAPESPEPPRKEMGFHIKEDGVPYRIKRRTGNAVAPPTAAIIQHS